MDEIVIYENYMNDLKFKGFTPVDLNFLMALCSLMRDKGTGAIQFTFYGLRQTAGYTRHSSKQFISDIRRMHNKLMGMDCTLGKGDCIVPFMLFSTFDVNLETETLTVSVNEEFMFILNDLTKDHTRFELGQFIDIDSKYAKNLYRLLKQFRCTGRYEVSMENFRERMDCPASYTNKHVMDKLIKPSLKELNGKGYFQNLKCETKCAHKRGAPVIGYIFTFTPEKIRRGDADKNRAGQPSGQK